ncbi:MAG: polysaccharide export protein [Beijerinckiaceae bacterium]|nr:polysaccharide export protein [Beijerinckiaceae bacterium]MDO9443320.1 polysaccharide biosynthesis/export family protein [Beijerinckiaceae bacterium]
MIKLVLVALTLLGASFFGGGFAMAQAGGEYRLDVQDKLRVRVIDWRTAVGDANEWKALSGEFVVNSSGNVSLPLIGEVKASGLSTSAFAALIAERLQAKVGLSQRPDASVEITEYRPFYILGTVATPGEYPYRPGLNALQALSIGGGLLRSISPGGQMEREALTGRGELRLLSVDQLTLKIRQARLEAELDNAAQLALPPEIASRSADRDVARLVREEQLLFDARRDSLQSQIASLNATKIVLAQEIDFLKAKGASLERQYELAKRELDNIASLAAKGLAVSGRQLSLEQNTAQFDTSRLEVSVASLRAKQDLSKMDREIAELRGKFRTETLVMLNEVRSKLATIAEKFETAQALLANSEAYQPALDVAGPDGEQRRPVFRVTRRVDGQQKTFVISETDEVLPGDVVSVSRERDQQRGGARDLTLRDTSSANAPQVR